MVAELADYQAPTNYVATSLSIKGGSLATEKFEDKAQVSCLCHVSSHSSGSTGVGTAGEHMWSGSRYMKRERGMGAGEARD